MPVSTIVLAPAGYLLDPDLGSDYERPWRLAEGLARRGLRVVIVARDVRRLSELGPNVVWDPPRGVAPESPIGRLIDRVRLYWHARRVVQRELSTGDTFVV